MAMTACVAGCESPFEAVESLNVEEMSVHNTVEQFSIQHCFQFV